jgi:hypothetical protein
VHRLPARLSKQSMRRRKAYRELYDVLYWIMDIAEHVKMFKRSRDLRSICATDD